MNYFRLIVLCCVFPTTLFSQANRAQVMVAYINNFARYTTWPNENQMDSFKIAVFTDHVEIKKELLDFSKTHRIKNRPISLRFPASYNNIGRVQLVLLTSEKSTMLLNLFDLVEGKPVLIVTEEYKDKRNVMINLYETNRQLMFEVNKANILNQNLAIDPEILLAGGTEIDVAGLYRTSQQSLRKMQREMEKMKDSLSHLQHDIRHSIDQIFTKNSEIVKQTELLDERNEKLNNLQKIIQSQQEVLSTQQDSMNQKNQALLNRQYQIRRQVIEVEKMEEVLAEKQKKIDDLNSEITNKNEVLGNQSQTIVLQKQLLFLFIIIVILVAILTISIFTGYRKNKQKRKILIYQKREIEEKLEELENLNIKLQHADQYKSIFLASMSHELRTPLNSIIGYTGILLMGMTGALNEEQLKQLGKVKNNARHLLSLINDILDISKIEADKVELHCEEFNLKTLVDEVVETMHPKVVEKYLEMSATIPDDLIISTDIRRIKQVILNLVSNAVNYSDTGTIQIQAERLPGNKFKLSVKDTGIGIAENEIARLFQPFQQIDSSLTKKNKGTGLGLYLCRKLMVLLKGDIFVNSELGKGSDFYIVMPVKIN